MKEIIITIYFAGLISHIGPDVQNKTYSAILSDVLHQPTVEWLDQATGALKTMEVQGTDVFHLTPKGSAARPDASFIEGVPSLRELTFKGVRKADLHSNTGTHHSDVAGYFRLPGGDLSVSRWYPATGIYYDKKTILKEACIAKTVTLKIGYSAGAQVQLRHGKLKANKRVTDSDAIEHDEILATFTTDATIGVINQPIVSFVRMTPHPIGPHWKKHGALTDNDRMAKIAQGEACRPLSAPTHPAPAHPFAGEEKMSTALVPAAGARILNRLILTPADIECSNSAFP